MSLKTPSVDTDNPPDVTRRVIDKDMFPALSFRVRCVFSHGHAGLKGWLAVLCVLVASSGAGTKVFAGDDGGIPLEKLKRLSIEELANLEVTTAEKRAEPLSETPAAIYVLTGEDVQRLGVTTVAEALRYVPGVQVARINAQNWAISARGFNDLFANKLLVLIDGRSVYTPLYSGVYWQDQNVLLHDLDRIEVVRGPGATVWGANAVNGVINILTKSAAETQGLLVSGGAGTPENGAAARYGGRLSETAAYRVYAAYSDIDNFPLANGQEANDRWWQTHGGFRLDWDPSEESRFTLQGDVRGSRADQSYLWSSLQSPTWYEYRESRVDSAGANLLGRWTRQMGDDSELRLQTYYDYSQKRDAGFYEFDLHQFDVDLQYQVGIGERQVVTSGVTYRFVADDFHGSGIALIEPFHRIANLIGAFVQDEIQWIPDHLSMTVGTKVEHNDYSGFEIQPGLRVTWTPDDRQTIWASIARAVRTPSRSEADAISQIGIIPPAAPGMPPSVLKFFGQDTIGAEDLLAFEMGYRIRPIARLSIDVTAFFNQYDDLLTASTGEPPDLSTLPDYVTIPLPAANAGSGQSHGVEAAVNVQVTEWWRVRTGYTWLDLDLNLPDDRREGSDPRHSVFVVSQMDLPHDFTLDLGYRFVDRLPAQGVSAYSALDARIAWRPTPALEVAIAGQNLLDNRHSEFGSSTYTGLMASEVPRGVYATVTWSY